MDFHGKVLVGPMVRVSQLGFRVHCAREGSGPVFSEECLAPKLAKCVRRVDIARGVVEFIERVPRGPREVGKVRETVIFATPLRRHAGDYPEGQPVVLQLGAANVASAVAAACVVCHDVDGIDLNMGCPRVVCPEKYDQGYGAALMAHPDTACAILRGVITAVPSLPVSAKTRLMDTDEESVAFLRAIAATGVRAITLHARTRLQRGSTPAAHARAATVRAMLGPDFPCALILNGDVVCPREGLRLAMLMGFDGAMMARGAMNNPSVFRSVLPSLPVLDALCESLRHHCRYGSPVAAMKYHLTRSLQTIPAHAKIAKQCYRARDVAGLGAALGMTSDECAAMAAAYVCPVRFVFHPADFEWPTHSCVPDEFPCNEDE